VWEITSGILNRRVSVSGVLKILGVSRSGYRAWLKHVPSDSQKRKEAIKFKIKEIYNDSHQNYGAPKIRIFIDEDNEGEEIITKDISFDSSDDKLPF
jgi:hypothetical protein